MSTIAAPVIWRISDGRAGHDTQSTGLAEALQRRLDCQVLAMNARPRPAALIDFVGRRYRPGTGQAPPDLIIGAGRRNHTEMLAARHSYGGRCIVIMRPGLPTSWFDLCLIPAHDQPPPAPNVVTTKGALNRMRPGANHPRQGLILIGGPSRHHDWDEDRIISRIREVVADDHEIHWTITDSPRTPTTTGRLLARGLAAPADYRPFHECPPGWLAAMLPETGVAWVSEDSVSMIYEALSAGCRVGLLDVPRRAGSSRVIRGIDSLVREAFVTPYAHWQQTRILPPAPALLQEADRCAAIIVERFLGGRS
ncbi:MAG: mitochondrial fission ELM1 family protein [Gammaproteobacteria bacterium]|nr:mitochondrial fission ELM1 family protein [Gammaproteobacteria bacterium]